MKASDFKGFCDDALEQIRELEEEGAAALEQLDNTMRQIREARDLEELARKEGRRHDAARYSEQGAELVTASQRWLVRMVYAHSKTSAVCEAAEKELAAHLAYFEEQCRKSPTADEKAAYSAALQLTKDFETAAAPYYKPVKPLGPLT